MDEDVEYGGEGALTEAPTRQILSAETQFIGALIGEARVHDYVTDCHCLSNGMPKRFAFF